MAQAGARFDLIRALLTYPVRSPETIGTLLTPSPGLFDEWNRLASQRRVVALAGVDTHAKLVLLEDGAGNSRYSLPIPGYEPSFRVLSMHVRPSSPLTGDAPNDATALLSAIRDGQLYTAVDAWASPAAFEFTATNRSSTAHQGEFLAIGGPVLLRVRSNAPDGFLTTVWRGSDAIAEKGEREFTLDAGEGAAIYRVTIRDPRRSASPPWLISNPIYVSPPSTPAPIERRVASGTRLSLFDGQSTAGWTKESDRISVSAIEAVQMISGVELRLRYGLSGGSAVGQYSGAAVETAHGVRDYDRVTFTIRAEHPMRLAIQVRAEVPNAPPERWQRSIYIDATETERFVSFDDMRPVGVTHTPRAVPENVRAIMFIVDTTNNKPGASGRIWLKNVRLDK